MTDKYIEFNTTDHNLGLWPRYGREIMATELPISVELLSKFAAWQQPDSLTDLNLARSLKTELPDWTVVYTYLAFGEEKSVVVLADGLAVLPLELPSMTFARLLEFDCIRRENHCQSMCAYETDCFCWRELYQQYQ